MIFELTADQASAITKLVELLTDDEDALARSQEGVTVLQSRVAEDRTNLTGALSAVGKTVDGTVESAELIRDPETGEVTGVDAVIV